MIRHALGLAIVGGSIAACDDDPISPSTIIGGSWKPTALRTAGSPPAIVRARERRRDNARRGHA
jgi:hypothetical protein